MNGLNLKQNVSLEATTTTSPHPINNVMYLNITLSKMEENEALKAKEGGVSKGYGVV